MYKAQDIAKKQHRERAQPQNRKKWGLLEKKKDYKLRAADYHRKQAQLALLRAKAESRNDDEFNFGMIRNKTTGGVLQKNRGNQALETDAVKLLKTQDDGYIRTLIGNEERKIEKSRNALVVGGTGKHTVFVDDEEDLESFDAAKHFKTTKSQLHRRENRLRESQLDDLPDEVDAETQHAQLADLEKLSKRIDRRNELSKVRQELTLQRELMKKGDKKKIVSKDGTVSYKWKNVRKK